MAKNPRRSIQTIQRTEENNTYVDLKELMIKIIDGVNNPTPKMVSNQTCSISSRQKNILIESGIFIFAILAIYNYIEPSMKYADSDHPLLPFFDELSEIISHEGVKIFAAACVNIPTIALLYMSMMHFLAMQRTNVQSDEVKAYLQKNLSKLVIQVQQGFIVFGSFLSSITLSSVILLYEKNVHLIIPFLTIALVANTLSHLLPFKLMMSKIAYRLPIELIKKPIEFFLFLLKSKQERYLDAREEQTIKGAEQIKNYIVAVLTKSQINYQLEAIKFDCCHLKFKIDQSNRQDLVFEELFPEIIFDQKYERGLVRLLCSLNRYVLNNPFKLFTGMLSIMGCAGYFMNLFNLMNKKFENEIWAGITVAIPTYAFAVLLFFFGTDMGNNIINFLCNWRKHDIKIPLEYKLHFRKSIPYTLASAGMASYSHASALQLLEDNTPGWESNPNLRLLKSWLIIFVMSGIIFLCFNIMLQFFQNISRKYSAHAPWIDDQERNIISYDNKIEQVKNIVREIDPQVLENSILGATNEATVKRISGQSAECCKKIVDSEKIIQDKMTKGIFSRVYSFYYKQENDEEVPLNPQSKFLN